jgi:Fe2+-dicitrate sensor, membrane component
MNSGTALDLTFDHQQRRIRLLAGEIMVQTGKAGDGRPFWVETPMGSLQALGTGFSVRLAEDSALLAVEQGAVSVRPGALAQAAAVIQAGEQVRSIASGCSPLRRWTAMPWRGAMGSWWCASGAWRSCARSWGATAVACCVVIRRSPTF